MPRSSVLAWSMALLLVPTLVVAQAPHRVVIDHGLAYHQAGSRVLAMDVYRPEDPATESRPGVVCIHGGSWNSGDRWDMARFARDLTERGFVAATIDYRLSGEAPFPAAIADARNSVLWLAANGARFGLDPRRIGVFGPSAGGHLALMVATMPVPRTPGAGRLVQACAAWFAPTDLLHGVTDGDVVPRASLEAAALLVGGPFETHRHRFAQASPALRVTPVTPPLFLAHGERDEVVPFSQAEYMVEAAQRHRVEVTLVRVRNAGHEFRGRLADPPALEIWARTVAFFRRRLERQDRPRPMPAFAGPAAVPAVIIRRPYPRRG